MKLWKPPFETALRRLLRLPEPARISRPAKSYQRQPGRTLAGEWRNRLAARGRYHDLRAQGLCIGCMTISKDRARCAICRDEQKARQAR